MSKHKRKPAKLALEINNPKERGCVVTAARARWKDRHASDPDDALIRFVRFVWMRHPFPAAAAHQLHAGLLGKAMRRDLLSYGIGEAEKGLELLVTSVGKRMLEEDRHG